MDFAGALVGHLVGDYILQNDFLAQGKKRDSCICGMHVIIYTACVLLFSGWWLHWPYDPPQTVLALVAAIAIPHFLIDRLGFVPWWMRLIGQEKFMGPPLGPWSIIVVDNVMHLVCLFWTWQILELL